MEPRRTTGLLKVFSIQLKRTRLTRLKKREGKVLIDLYTG
jgi:hypothetical protein